MLIRVSILPITVYDHIYHATNFVVDLKVLCLMESI